MTPFSTFTMISIISPIHCTGRRNSRQIYVTRMGSCYAQPLSCTAHLAPLGCRYFRYMLHGKVHALITSTMFGQIRNYLYVNVCVSRSITGAANHKLLHTAPYSVAGIPEPFIVDRRHDPSSWAPFVTVATPACVLSSMLTPLKPQHCGRRNKCLDAVLRHFVCHALARAVAADLT